MNRRRPLHVALLLALVLAIGAPAATAGDPPAAAGVPNVRLKITVGTMEAGKPRPAMQYEVVTPGDGETVKLQRGTRIPIPATSFAGDAPGQAVVSYSYQNVGVSALLGARVRTDGRVMLNATIEDSSVSSGAALGAQPIVALVSFDGSAVLRPGRPLRLTQMEEPGGLSAYIEVTAEVLD